MRRSSSYDRDLSEKLKNHAFSQGYLLTLMEGEEGLSLEEALRTTIQSMGVKEFCAIAHMRKQNVNDFLKERRKLKPESYNAFLNPFGLQIRMIVEKKAS
jgi:hypothetical protein